MESITNFLELDIITVGNYSLKVFSVFNVILILLLTKLLLWFIRKTLFRKKHLPDFDEGNTLAILQIIAISFGLWL